MIHKTKEIDLKNIFFTGASRKAPWKMLGSCMRSSIGACTLNYYAQKIPRAGQIGRRHFKRVQLTNISISRRYQLLLVIVSYIFLKFVYIMVSFIIFANICVVIHDFRSFSGVNLPVLASCGVHPSSFGFTSNLFFSVISYIEN